MKEIKQGTHDLSAVGLEKYRNHLLTALSSRKIEDKAARIAKIEKATNRTEAKKAFSGEK